VLLENETETLLALHVCHRCLKLLPQRLIGNLGDQIINPSRLLLVSFWPNPDQAAFTSTTQA